MSPLALTLVLAASEPPVTVTVLSAVVKDQRIAGAEVTLQKNGSASVTSASSSTGVASVSPGFSDKEPGVLLIVKKPGYSTLVARCPCQGMTYALSPVMQQLDGLRVVLSWGASPMDLDLHAVFPDNHVFFRSKEGVNANLDVDDIDGFGPETITIRARGAHPYLFAVHDYSHFDKTTAALAESSAKVFVYVGQTLLRRYEVPRAGLGTLWEVFALDENGELIDLNRIVKTDPDPRPELWRALSANHTREYAVRPGDVGLEAARLNAEGERAYHAGQLEESVWFYQQALELEPNHGQAWSNLGLSFRKLNRTAEALWANRKSIALANGPDANTVRASSHYNIARIYEAAGQFAEALAQYELANRERPMKVYEDARRRVVAKVR